MTRSSRIGIVVVAVFLGLLVAIGGAGGGAAARVVLSADRHGPGGARALALALDALGVRVEPDPTPPLEWPDPHSRSPVRVVLAPTRVMLAAELRRVREWVEAGGSLVVAADPSPAIGADDSLYAALAEAVGAATWPPATFTAQEHALGAGRVLLVGNARDFASALFVGNAQDVSDHDGTIEARSIEAVVLRRTVATTPSDEAVAMLLRLVAFARGRALHFDESAHGRGPRIDPTQRLLGWLAGTRAGNVALALLPLGIAGLFVYGARRGPPLPPDSLATSGRSSLEHATALAEAWRRARPGRRPTTLFLAELAERIGAGSDRESLERRLDAIAQRSPGDARDVAVVRSAMRSGASGSLAPLAAAIERITSHPALPR